MLTNARSQKWPIPVLIILPLLAWCLGACNDSQGMKGGDKGKEGENSGEQPIDANKTPYASDASNSGDLSGNGQPQDPSADDSETRIATQPAYVSGAFLAAKVIKVQQGFVYLGAAAYDNGILIHDSNPEAVDQAVLPAGSVAEPITWLACYERRGCLQITPDHAIRYSKITHTSDVLYSAIFKVPVADYLGLTLKASFKSYLDVPEAFPERKFARKDGQCGADGCELSCKAGTNFYHWGSIAPGRRLLKYTINGTESLAGKYYGVTKPCDVEGMAVYGSFKVHFSPLSRLTPASGTFTEVETAGAGGAGEAAGHLWIGDAGQCSGSAIDRMQEDVIQLLHPSSNVQVGGYESDIDCQQPGNIELVWP